MKFLNNKRGVQLTLSTVVIAVLVIIVLIVLIVIFTQGTGLFNIGITSCVDRGGKCEVDADTCLNNMGSVYPFNSFVFWYKQCRGYQIIYRGYFMNPQFLKRNASSDKGTFGMLVDDQIPWLLTVELPWKKNEQGISCISEGPYICKRIISEMVHKN